MEIVSDHKGIVVMTAATFPDFLFRWLPCQAKVLPFAMISFRIAKSFVPSAVRGTDERGFDVASLISVSMSGFISVILQPVFSIESTITQMDAAILT